MFSLLADDEDVEDEDEEDRARGPVLLSSSSSSSSAALAAKRAAILVYDAGSARVCCDALDSSATSCLDEFRPTPLRACRRSYDFSFRSSAAPVSFVSHSGACSCVCGSGVSGVSCACACVCCSCPEPRPTPTPAVARSGSWSTKPSSRPRPASCLSGSCRAAITRVRPVAAFNSMRLQAPAVDRPSIPCVCKPHLYRYSLPCTEATSDHIVRVPTLGVSRSSRPSI